jgi:single-strand DNA-binding protein
MASRSVNRATIIGNLTRDAETKFTPSGVAKTTFSVATNHRAKDQTGEWKDEPTFHNIVLWRSENVANYLLKGKSVYVDGRIANRSYDDKDGVKRYISEIVANEVILLGGGPREESAEPPLRSMPRASAPKQAAIDDPNDPDFVPF